MVRRIDDTRECFKLNELIKIYYIYDVVGFIFQHISSHCLFPLCVKEGANKQVISSQADSLIKISRIWADFFPANTSNQPI